MGNWHGKGKKGKEKVGVEGEAELRHHVDNMIIEPRLTSVASTRNKGPKGRKPPTKMQKIMNLMKASKELKKKEKAKGVEVVTVKDLDSVTKAPVLDSLTGGRPAPPKNRRQPTHVRGGGRKSMASRSMEEKEIVGRKKVATHTGSTPQSVKEAQAEPRQRSSSVGPPVPEAGSKPLLPDKGNKPKKKVGFLRPSSPETLPTQESAMSPLSSVEEEDERELSQKSAGLTNESVQPADKDNPADLGRTKENQAEAKIPTDSGETKVNTCEGSTDLEEDKEKAAATKEIRCDVSELGKPLALAFTAPVAIEFKQLEAIQFEKCDNKDEENSNEPQQDENLTDKNITEDAQEKWKDAVDIAVNSKSEENMPTEDNLVKDEEKKSSDTAEEQEEENNNDILSKSKSVENKVVDKASIEECNNKDVKKVKTEEENKEIGITDGVHSSTTHEEERLASTNEEKPIEADELEAFISGRDGTEEAQPIPVTKASDKNEDKDKNEEKLVEVSAGSIHLVENLDEEEKCSVAEVVRGEKA